MVRSVVGGVDAHADTQVAAVIDANGGALGIASFPANESEFEAMLGWFMTHGEIQVVGAEGTGSWGVGLARFLHDHEISVVEVDRPNRQNRRRFGKSDTTDAVAPVNAPKNVPLTQRGFAMPAGKPDQSLADGATQQRSKVR